MKNIQNNERELFKKFISKNEEVLDVLSKQERQIIKLRYGLFDGWERAQKHIGELFNISDTRVAQIEAYARHKITIAFLNKNKD